MLRIPLYIALILTSSICFGEESPEPASKTLIWSKRLRIYYTQWVNYFVKDDSHTNVSAMNQQKGSTEPERTDFAFACPGNSYLIGVASQYEKRPYDRMFRFICAFIDNEKGEQMRKSSCTTKITPYDNKGGDDATFTCEENKYLHGLGSALRPAEDEDDRLYKPFCCHMEDWAKTKITLNTSSCTESEGFGGSQNAFEFKCPTDTIMTKIKTTYSKSVQDRKFYFTCCNVWGLRSPHP